MSKMKNQRIYSSDLEHLKMLAEEQRVYIGREYSLDLTNGCLTIYALPQKKHKPKHLNTKGSDLPKEERNKREEKFERRA
jgi:hypothetical protein